MSAIRGISRDVWLPTLRQHHHFRHSKPSVSVGSLEFQMGVRCTRAASRGYSSTHFSGFLQGNPVTGAYEAHNDCSLTWTLQDDSGNYQHFTGTMTPGF